MFVIGASGAGKTVAVRTVSVLDGQTRPSLSIEAAADALQHDVELLVKGDNHGRSP